MQFRYLGALALAFVLVAGSSFAVVLPSGLIASSAVGTIFEGHEKFALDPASLPQIGRLEGAAGMPGDEPKPYSCTGTLIGTRLVLTAAHCVAEVLAYNDALKEYNAEVRQYNSSRRARRFHPVEQDPRTLYFEPGVLGGELPAGAKKIAADMSRVWIGEFKNDEDEIQARNIKAALAQIVKETPTDYAILTLTESPSTEANPNLGALGLWAGAVPEGLSLISVGYSFDFDDSDTASVDTNCHVKRVFPNGTIFHDCAIESGASGGPLLSMSVNGVAMTKDNEDKLKAEAHAPGAKIDYKVVAVITSEIPVQDEGGEIFRVPGSDGRMHFVQVESGDGTDPDKYSDLHPNIANGVTNALVDAADALKQEQGEGLKVAAPAPVVGELKAVKEAQQSDDGDDRSSDDDDDNDNGDGGYGLFPGGLRIIPNW